MKINVGHLLRFARRLLVAAPVLIEAVTAVTSKGSPRQNSDSKSNLP